MLAPYGPPAPRRQACEDHQPAGFTRALRRNPEDQIAHRGLRLAGHVGRRHLVHERDTDVSAGSWAGAGIHLPAGGQQFLNRGVRNLEVQDGAHVHVGSDELLLRERRTTGERQSSEHQCTHGHPPSYLLSGIAR
jgi:hypothetical protein